MALPLGALCSIICCHTPRRVQRGTGTGTTSSHDAPCGEMNGPVCTVAITWNMQRPSGRAPTGRAGSRLARDAEMNCTIRKPLLDSVRSAWPSGYTLVASIRISSASEMVCLAVWIAHAMYASTSTFRGSQPGIDSARYVNHWPGATGAGADGVNAPDRPGAGIAGAVGGIGIPAG